MGPLSIEVPIAADRSQPSSRRIAPHVFFGPAVRDPLFPSARPRFDFTRQRILGERTFGFEVFDMPEALRCLARLAQIIEQDASERKACQRRPRIFG